MARTLCVGFISAHWDRPKLGDLRSPRRDLRSWRSDIRCASVHMQLIACDGTMFEIESWEELVRQQVGSEALDANSFSEASAGVVIAMEDRNLFTVDFGPDGACSSPKEMTAYMSSPRTVSALTSRRLRRRRASVS